MLNACFRFFLFSLFFVSVLLQACGKVETPANYDPYANLTTTGLGFDVDPPFFTSDANGNQKGLDSAVPGACGNAVLSWTPATDLVSGSNIIYYIYQSLTPGGEDFAAPPTYRTAAFDQTRFLVRNLLPSKTYYYVIRAVDEAGNLSDIDLKNLVERYVLTQDPRVMPAGNGPNLYCPGGYAPVTASSWLSYAGDSVQLSGSGLGGVSSVLFPGAVSSSAFITSTGVQAAVPPGAASGFLTTAAGSTSDAFLSFPQPENLSNSAAASISPGIAVSGNNVGSAWSDMDLVSGKGIIYYSGSSDKGTTFSAPVPVSNPGRFSSDPSVAFGGGNIYVTWTDLDVSGNNSDIYYSWSSDNGATFSVPRNLSWNGGKSTSARVSTLGGNVTVVWRDESVLYGLTSVWGSTAADVYLAGKEGRIYHSSDLGKTWIRENYNPGGPDLNGLWGSGSADIYAVGGGGAILHTPDGGATWGTQTSAVTADLAGVWGSGAGDVYAIGAGGTILHTANSGLTWSSQTFNTALNLRGIWGSSSSDVYAVGTAGTILHSTNGGASWSTTQSVATTLNFNAIWGSGSSDIYIAADNGTVYHSTGGGAWNSAPAGGGAAGLIPQNLLSVWGATYTPAGTTIPVTVIYSGAAGGKIVKKSGASAWESNTVVIGGDFDVNGLWGQLSATDAVIYGVQGDGPVMKWNTVSWSPLWPDSSNGEIFYRQFPPAGPAYPLAAPVRLSNASGAIPQRAAESPDITPAGGDLWFSWTEGNAPAGTYHNQSSIYLSRTADGVSFSPPSTLIASPAACISYQIPRMAYDGAGMIYLVFQETYQYDVDPAWNCLAKSSDFSQVEFAPFSVPLSGLPATLSPKLISVSSGEAKTPVIAASGQTVTVVWTDMVQNQKNELFLISSPDGGATFTPPVDFSSPFLIEPSAVSFAPFLINSGGNLYLAWTQHLWPVGIIDQNYETFFSRF